MVLQIGRSSVCETMCTESVVMAFQGCDASAHRLDKAFFPAAGIAGASVIPPPVQRPPTFWVSPRGLASACSLPMPFGLSRLASSYALTTSASCPVASRETCALTSSSPAHGFARAAEVVDGNSSHGNDDTLTNDGSGRNKGISLNGIKF